MWREYVWLSSSSWPLWQVSLGRGDTQETVNACSVASTEVLAFNLVWTMQLVFIIPSVTFPSHILEHIGIFQGWMQLTKITIGSTLKSLGHYFFFFYQSFYSLHGTHSDFVLPFKRNHTCFSWINSNFKIKKTNFQIHLPPQRLHCYISWFLACGCFWHLLYTQVHWYMQNLVLCLLLAAGMQMLHVLLL